MSNRFGESPWVLKNKIKIVENIKELKATEKTWPKQTSLARVKWIESY